MRKIQSIEEKNKADAKAMLIEASEQGFDAVIVLGFMRKKHLFSIKSSSVHERLELLGALREAEHHLIMNGVSQ